MTISMTGFGRSQEVIDDFDILVEIKSVNHRYFEFYARTPRAYNYLEDKLKSLVQSKISRGKIEVSLTILKVNGKETEIEANKNVVDGYVKALREIKDEFNLIDDLSLSNISRLPDVFTVRKKIEDEDYVQGIVLSVAQKAIDCILGMKQLEGNNIKTDFENRLAFIEQKVSEIESLMAGSVDTYRQKLYNKIKEVLEQKNIDESRVLTEVAIFSEKIAVDEETVRLKSHIEQFLELVNSAQTVGRKLDFLVQEMNREINTIGSKSQDIEISKIVVDIKAEIEKIREQVQNIE